MQVGNTIPSREAAAKNRETIAAAHPGLLKLARGPILATFSALAVILGGSFASVQAAERSLPGDTLYMLKLVTEQTRLAFTSSKPNKVKLKAEFTNRRVDDLKTVIHLPEQEPGKKEARVRAAADIIKQDLDTIKEQLDEVQKEGPAVREVAETAKAVEKGVTEVAKKLKEVKSELIDEVKTPEVKKKMNEAHAQATDVGMKALEVLVGVRNEEDAKEVVTDEEIGASISLHQEAAKEAVAKAFELVAAGTVTTTTTGDEGVERTSSTESGLNLANDAKTALEEVQSLMDEDRVDEAVGKLKEASVKSFLAQSQAEDEHTTTMDTEVVAEGDEESSTVSEQMDSSEGGEMVEGEQQATSTEAEASDG
jgi:hypothetical protein